MSARAATMTKLPDQPESVASMRARWQEAIAHPVDLDKNLADPDHAFYPSKFRTHVFDSQGGIRMILSRDKCREWERIHASFSCTLATAVRLAGSSGVQGIVTAYRNLFQAVTGIKAKPVDTAFSPSGVVHVYFEVTA